MARTLKGTRARGLPAKVLLSQRQDATGSFPTVWRTASDSRTGRYPVFFNDDKVIPFNQPVTDVGFTATTYPEYEEKVVTIGSPGNPVNQSNAIAFGYSFSGVPTVVLTEVTPNPNTPTVNAFIDVLSYGGMTIKFSAPFEGTVVYRALYDVTGTPVNVLRSPRYTDQYALVVANNFDNTTYPDSNTADITFSDFGSVPTENYVTFYDLIANNQANLSSSISVITNTSVQVTGSAPGAVVLFYMGVGTSTASVDVSGIVYPLVMTPQAINAGLSPEAKADLYKQPYFSGSVIVNRPIVASGSMKKNVSDTFVTFTPGQDIKPFSDFANPAVDGKKTVANPFYATGSIPITFGGPVWSKSKFEIFFTSSATKNYDNIVSTYKDDSVFYGSGQGPMMYWDTSQQNFVGLDDKQLQQDLSATSIDELKKFLDRQHIGFGYSMDSNNYTYDVDLIDEEKSYLARGNQISNFGFPYHEKFKPKPTQTISMQDYISEPFLLEKIVLYVSATLDYGVYQDDTVCTSSFAQWTFFILNERSTYPQQSDEQIISASCTGSFYPFSSSSQINTTIRDVVDYVRIAVTEKPATIYQARDLNLIRAPTERYITNQFIVSSSLKSANQFDEGVRSVWFSDISNNKTNAFIEQNHHAGRDGLDVNFRNGRNWLSIYDNRSTIGTASYWFPDTSKNNTFTIKSSYQNTPNPYLLLPTDKLVFGWQMPLDMDQFVVSSSLNFGKNNAGVNKVVFYGSLMRLNEENMLEEYHDTLNQLVSSETIHEVIGG